MRSLQGIENHVLEAIRQATDGRQFTRLAGLSSLAAEMEARRNDWNSRFLSLMESSEGDSGPANHSVRARPTPALRGESHTGRRIRGFELFGRHVPVKTYKALLLGVSNQLRRKDRDAFDRVALALRGRKRVYFSRDVGELKFGEELGRGLFVETNLNANLIVSICNDLVEGLGLPPNALKLVN